MAINVATGTEISLKDLCLTLLEVMGSDLEPEFLPLPNERKGVEVTRRLADTRKAAEPIGFKAGVSLREGLGRFVEWLDAQEERVQ